MGINRDFESVDFYNIDEILTEEQKLIRNSVRGYGKDIFKNNS